MFQSLDYNCLMDRFFKQLLFAIIFLAILGAVGFGVYKLAKEEPTCFDKIQNQTEEGVDCGAVCGNICLSSLKPVEVKSSYLLKIKEEGGWLDHDALFRVYNPNTQFGSSRVEYELAILDNQGISLLNKIGWFYILPGQTKYIYEPLLKTKSPGQRAELRITKIDWQKLTGVFSEDAKFVARSKDYFTGDQPGIFSRVSGTIFNVSDFDVDRVEVVAVLFKDGQPIGAGRTTLTTFQAKTDRFYEITWVAPVPVPDRVEVEAQTNVFANSNFLRKYGTPEKFQQP